MIKGLFSLRIAFDLEEQRNSLFIVQEWPLTVSKYTLHHKLEQNAEFNLRSSNFVELNDAKIAKILRKYRKKHYCWLEISHIVLSIWILRDHLKPSNLHVNAFVCLFDRLSVFILFLTSFSLEIFQNVWNKFYFGHSLTHTQTIKHSLSSIDVDIRATYSGYY